MVYNWSVAIVVCRNTIQNPFQTHINQMVWSCLAVATAQIANGVALTHVPELY